MAYTKNDLVLKGEVLLNRLQKEHRNIRKAYKLKQQDDIDVIARLIVSYQVLTDRIANETIIFGTTPPTTSLSHEEKKDRHNRILEINEMLKIAEKVRALSKDLLNSTASDMAAQLDKRAQDNMDFINDAKKQLDELGFNEGSNDFNLDDISDIEEICAEKTPVIVQ